MRFPEFNEPWETSTLQGIAEFSKGAGISKEQRSETGLPCILYGELYTTYSNEVIEDVVSRTDLDPTDLVKSQSNDVIIPSSGETAEDIATARCVFDDNVLLGGDLNIIRLNEPHDGRFMSYQLNGIRKYDIARIAQGVSVVHLYSNELKKLSVSLPQSVEQKRIADFIGLLDRRIAVQSKLIEDLQQLKSAICKKLLSHSSWNEYIIDDICDSVSFKEYIAEVEENGSFPIIQQGETPILGYGNKKPYYNYNSVIIFGDHTLSLYKPQVPFLVATDGVKMLSPKPFVTRDFLYYLIETFMPISQGYKRHFSILKEQIIRLPSLKEQTIIGKRLSLLDTKIRIEQQLYDCYISQKQYLLGQMFI